MNSIQSIPRKLALAIFAFVALFDTSFGASIGDMNKDALAAMKSGKWAEAQAILVKATNAYDPRAPQLYGPRFRLVLVSSRLLRNQTRHVWGRNEIV